MGITEYLQHSVFDVRLFPISGVSQYIILSRQRQLGWKPVNGINVNHPLHIEQIKGYLNGVTLAYLIDWLNVRPID